MGEDSQINRLTDVGGILEIQTLRKKNVSAFFSSGNENIGKYIKFVATC